MSDRKNFPIILAHGIARFDYLRESLIKRLQFFIADLNFSQDRTHYFRGIATYLIKHGFETYHTNVSFASGVEVRARELRQEILRILEFSGHEMVHIIGHSMGGLDSRQMIVHEDMADKVASLTTIGTPHLGTSFANWGLSQGGGEIIQRIRKYVNLEGFLTLTFEARKAFNEAARNSEAENNVVYQTYAGFSEYKYVFTPIKPSWKIINEAEGANDGLVSVISQRWMPELVSDGGVTKKVNQNDFPVPADHLNQVGGWGLEELYNTRWWPFGIFKEKRRYELSIKNIYLKIAREVTGKY